VSKFGTKDKSGLETQSCVPGKISACIAMSAKAKILKLNGPVCLSQALSHQHKKYKGEESLVVLLQAIHS
jgi:hypothetical protein